MRQGANSIWNKKLPRFFGIFVLVASLGTIFWLSRNVVLFESKAAIGNTPKNVQISNIRNDGFTVSYTTDEEVTGSLSFGTDTNVSQVALDDQDTGSPTPRKIHHISVKNVPPGTKHFFSIASGDGVFQNDSAPYEVTTVASAVPSSSSPITISGKVVLEDGSAASEGILYVSSSESQIVSVVLKQDGSYSLKLNGVLKKDLSGPAVIAEGTTMTLQVLNSSQKSTVSFFAENADPLPQIVLSKDYDFALGSGLASTTTATDSAQITGFPELPDEGGGTAAPAIISPKNDEEFKDQQPLFEGKALPNTTVEITINSEHEITATVESDANGNWEFRPSTPLEPGEHTITIRTLSPSGIVQTLSRSFTVFAQGSQFIEPSVSPTRTVTPTAPAITATPTPTPSPTLQPSAGPTTEPSVLPTLSTTPAVIIPTTTLSPIVTTPVPQITTPPIPDSGSSALTIGLIGISILMGIGSLLFFLL